MTLNLGTHSLVAEDDVEAFLGITVASLTSSETNTMSFLLNIASQQICSFAGRAFALASYSECFDGGVTDLMIPREWPVQSVVSLKFCLDGDFSAAPAMDAKNYRISSDGTSVDLREGNLTPRGRGTAELVYTAGYSPMNYDLRFATLIQYQYLRRQSGSSGNPMLGLKSIGKMNESQTKDSNIETHGLCGEALGIVDKYRRMEAPRTTMFQRIG